MQASFTCDQNITERPNDGERNQMQMNHGITSSTNTQREVGAVYTHCPPPNLFVQMSRTSGIARAYSSSEGSLQRVVARGVALCHVLLFV